MSVRVFPILTLPPSSLPIPSLRSVVLLQRASRFFFSGILQSRGCNSSMRHLKVREFKQLAQEYTVYVMRPCFLCFCDSKTWGIFTSPFFSFSLVQSLSRVWLFVTPWAVAHQASLSTANSRSSCPQTHVHRVGNTIQPSHPLSSPSPPAFSLSQHQGLFQWVSSSHQVIYFI